MYIRLSTGPVHDSGKDPVMVLFSKDELTKFKSLPESEDIFISYPNDWDDKKRDQWVDQSRDMIKATLKSAMAANVNPDRREKAKEPLKLVPDVVMPPLESRQQPLPSKNEAVVISNDSLLEFLEKGNLNADASGKSAAVEMTASFEVVDATPEKKK
jgi:hypothetical protein